VGKSACAGTNSHCLAFPRWTDGTLSIFSTKAKLRKAILLLGSFAGAYAAFEAADIFAATYPCQPVPPKQFDLALALTVVL
jgi:hypothetical protein